MNSEKEKKSKEYETLTLDPIRMNSEKKRKITKANQRKGKRGGSESEP